MPNAFSIEYLHIKVTVISFRIGTYEIMRGNLVRRQEEKSIQGEIVVVQAFTSR